MKKTLSAVLSTCVLYFFVVDTCGQDTKSAIIRYDTAARAGFVTLNDGTDVQGRIVFNDNDGIVTLFNGDESKSFNAREILKFQLYGRETGRERVFYSMEYDDPDTGFKDVQFFEILKELKSFAVVVKIDRIKTEARKRVLMPASSPLLVDRSNKKFTQTQTVFFMDTNGKFEPFLKILEKEFDGALLDWNEKHNRFIDTSLFEKYTGEHYPKLLSFAKQNRLSFKRKDDLVVILDHYEQLAGQ
ncbi:MAG TPA: hypothetical protein VEB86_09560 [Chryseosolibacter sp.]|nr:hypothetical protein [Chryseosolibacter sp.]